VIPSVAIVDPRRDLKFLDSNGRPLPGLGQPELMWADWSAARTERTAHSWPTWSPDGTRIAVFRQHASTSETHVYVTDVGGARAAELMNLERKLPIHLEWSPGGEALAVLCQQSNRLVLELLDAPNPGRRVPVASGSPLFYSWADAQQLAVFIGRPDSGSELRLVGPSSQTTLPGVPGNFCTPVHSGGEVLYVAHRSAQVELLAARPTGEVRVIEEVDGLMALVPSADGARVAKAVAERDGAPYRRLSVLDPATGAQSALADIPLLAFFWSPAGDAVIGARQEPDEPHVTWYRLGLDGSKLPLFRHVPSRDLAFWLRFFEQYCVSHPCIDAGGRHLILGGFEDERTGDSTLWRVPLDGGPVESVGPGVLAVCGPR
jgi:dipeptidyl aminopeptidase/acylaminoacyl peptidase